MFFLVFGVTADDRTENIDVFLVVDKSLSMEEEIAAVKEYINDEIVDKLLIEGDQLTVIVFYGQADLLISRSVTDSKDSMISTISRVRADGRFTDIGNALDALREVIPERETEGRRKYLLLITDGIQEAPPESPYYSSDGTFNHEFLENTKEIVKEGWKIHILGIGSSTAAQEIAESLAGTYSEVEEEPTKEELAEATSELLGIIEVTAPVKMKAVGQKATSKLTFSLTSDGYTIARTVAISGVTLTMPDGGTQPVLNEPFEVSIEPDETVVVSVPLMLTTVPEAGSYSGEVTFAFAGDTSFSPGFAQVDYRVKGFIGNNIIWLIPVAVVLLAALAALGIFIPKILAGGGSIAFVCIVDDGTVRKRQYKLKYSATLFLVEGMMGLTVNESAGSEPVAEITADGMGLHLTILNAKDYNPAESIPSNVLDQEIVIVKKYGKKAKITFETP